MKLDFLKVGQIVGTHGIRGFVRVQFWCDNAEFFCRFTRLLSVSGTEFTAEKAQPHGNVVLLKLKDVDSLEEAEQLRGTVLLVRREDICLENGRYFIEELLGCSAFSRAGDFYGKITDVSKTGANDVWHIEKDGREYLFPAVSAFITSVDVVAEKAILNPPEGIFDNEN